jgi:hypothetical protein
VSTLHRTALLVTTGSAPTPPPAALPVKVWDGTDWILAEAKAWDGAAWQPAQIKVYDGSEWD